MLSLGECIAILVGLSSQLNFSDFIDSMKTTMSDEYVAS